MRYYVLLLITLIFPVCAYASDSTYERYVAHGIAAFEAKDYKSAVNEFKAALKENPEGHSATLYLGIALSRSGDDEAIGWLKKALAKNPEDQRTNLEVGIYYYSKAVYGEARDFFENVIKISPKTELAGKASEYLKELKKEQNKKPLSLALSTGIQYDSNVVLNSDTGPLPQGISGKSDWRAVFGLKGKYNFMDNKTTSGAVSYSFYQSLHSKLSEFNVSRHLIEIGAGYQLSPMFNLRGDYVFDYTLVGGDGYDRAHTLSPSLTISEGKGLSTVIAYAYRSDDFMDSDLFSTNSDRTGSNNSVGLTQHIEINDFSSLRISYNYDKQNARVDVWEYIGNSGRASLRYRLPRNVLLGLDADYAWKNYKGIIETYGENRKDREYTASVSATKMLSERYSITLGYLYTRNSSNIDLFDYKRSILSLFFNARF